MEIVIHDLKTDTICHVSGALSARKVGDPSLLDDDVLTADLSQIVYPKINFDGRLVKSISVPMEERWLICINCDVSAFSEIMKISAQFLNALEAKQPESLFKNDWQERLHVAIHRYLDEKRWHFAELNQRQKKEVIKHLFDHGAFAEKRAADYVANTLSVGRATVFNYLREWRTS